MRLSCSAIFTRIAPRTFAALVSFGSAEKKMTDLPAAKVFSFSAASPVMNFAIGAGQLGVFNLHVRQAGCAEFFGFFLQIVEPRAWLIEGLRNGHGADGLAGERLELALGEEPREVDDLDRDAQVGLVGAVAQH